MKTIPTQKTKNRIRVNTCLLFVMTVAFGALTFLGTQKLQQMSQNFKGLADSPNLCTITTETDSDGAPLSEQSYICSSEIDTATDDWTELTDPLDYTLFLYDQITFSSAVRSADFLTVLSCVGAMFTIAGAAATVIYWNHNRS